MRDASGRLVLRARVSAAPTDGEANAALVSLLARALGRPRRDIRLVAGAASRLKQVEIVGVSDAELGAAFGARE